MGFVPASMMNVCSQLWFFVLFLLFYFYFFFCYGELIVHDRMGSLGYSNFFSRITFRWSPVHAIGLCLAGLAVHAWGSCLIVSSIHTQHQTVKQLIWTLPLVCLNKGHHARGRRAVVDRVGGALLSMVRASLSHYSLTLNWHDETISFFSFFFVYELYTFCSFSVHSLWMLSLLLKSVLITRMNRFSSLLEWPFVSVVVRIPVFVITALWLLLYLIFTSWECHNDTGKKHAHGDGNHKLTLINRY